MKKIMVTVAEFTSHGGVMIDGTHLRRVFYSNGVELNIQDQHMYEHIILKNPNIYYVQVESKPIYK